ARRPRVLEADDSDPGEPALALLALGLGAVPRRPARPRLAAEGAPGPARRRDSRGRLPAPPQVAAPAGRPQRRPADRLRTGTHALVLPLPAVVLRLRRLRRARLRAGGPDGAGYAPL